MSSAVDYLAALHEAGHATVACMFGFDVKVAVLHAVGASQSEAGRVELRDHVFEIDDDPTRYLTYLLSGAAAEKRQTGSYSKRDASDLAQALTAAAVVLNVDRDSPRAVTAVRDAQALANALMLNNALWEWVQRVAAALIQRRRLTGRQIAELREDK
jgi:hypothetical protein